MPTIEAAEISAALTANGDVAGAGYATIASTAGFYAGARGFISNTAGASKRVIITEIQSATILGVRFIADDNESQLSIQVYGGRSSIAAYTTVGGARIYQESQLVRVDPTFTAPAKLNF
jgi:hypothetical protein